MKPQMSPFFQNPFLRWSLLALALLAVFMLFKKTEPSTPHVLPYPTDNIVTLNLGKEPPTLDPLRNTDSTSGRVIHEIMRGLTDFDKQAHIAPELAKSWQVSADGLRYT
ncbi:MAG: hypothetical protein ACK5T0_00335, partial [Vampirovibrionales bacterium]